MALVMRSSAAGRSWWAARSARAWPHGLWVLCPGESKREAPQLDGLRVEALTEAERVVLDREFLHGPRVADRAS